MQKKVLILLFIIFLVSCTSTQKQDDPAPFFEVVKTDQVENIVANPKIEILEEKIDEDNGESTFDKFIVSNPVNLDQIEKISKFRSCIGHDYSGLNVQGQLETLRTMKHYIWPKPELIGMENTVEVFAPFDGMISRIENSPPGKQVYISPQVSPDWTFIFFHIELLEEITKGKKVKAGQPIGFVSSDSKQNFDIGLKNFDIEGDAGHEESYEDEGNHETDDDESGGQVFESPFLHMNSKVLDEFKKLGVNTNNIIIKKGYRDSNECEVERYGSLDAIFVSGLNSEDYVEIK